jgi:predicted amidohydrolase YtcJ
VKTLLSRASAHVVRFGSDAPVEPLRPMRNLIACETIWWAPFSRPRLTPVIAHRNEAERVSRQTALRLSTPARSLVLAAGAPADVALWPADLLTCGHGRLEGLQPHGVYVGGRRVAGSASPPQP